LPETAKPDGQIVAEKLRAAVEGLEVKPIDQKRPGPPFVHTTISVGVASLADLPVHGDEQDLVRCADEALYAAKREGRNRVRVA